MVGLPWYYHGYCSLYYHSILFTLILPWYLTEPDTHLPPPRIPVSVPGALFVLIIIVKGVVQWTVLDIFDKRKFSQLLHIFIYISKQMSVQSHYAAVQ